MNDDESLDPVHHEGFDDNGNTAQTPPQSMEEIEDEVRNENAAYDRKGLKLLFAAIAKGEVISLPSVKPIKANVVCNQNTKFGGILKEWHLRLRHAGKERLIRTLSNQKIEGLPQIPYNELKKVVFFCKTCAHMKDRRISYRNMVGTKATEPLHTLHMDSTGKLRVNGLYASAVVADVTAYKWYFVVKSLKEIPRKIKDLLKKLSVQLPYKVCRIRTDGGTEFINKEDSKLCAKLGLDFQSSNVKSQEENGSIERTHQTMMTGVRSAFQGANMTAKWWPEALLYIVDVTNRLPMARLGMKSPYELLYNKRPSGLALRIWGETCYAHIPKSKRKDPKLGDRAVEFNYKGYRLLGIKANKYLIARDVKFSPIATEAMIQRSFPTEDISNDQSETTVIEQIESVTGRSTPCISIKEAQTSPHAEQWYCAIRYPFLKGEGHKVVIGYLTGSTQLYGIDYQEVFVPVAQYESLRLLLALPTILGFYLHKVDVSTAFLNGHLSDSIYMRQLIGFRSRSGKLVCKLKKSLYGLKQAPRIWWEVKGVMHILIICVYIDDLTIAGSHLCDINDLKDKLSGEFTMKNLGELHYLLKLEIKRDLVRKTLSMSQQKHIDDLLDKFQMRDCSVAPTPHVIIRQ
ncbi:Uncharacterized protein PHPALM_19960 [Phytophthora palmivora]|uniref:Integrase catalytic domain-containing protein n=1 Tax=Phytophthora palmivora TaxID=4796 RepID=A0A2P4XG28_9STRA|nr:Uncharacterized protein PHPALM_19960 [Phytophthora palmivora]